MKERKVGLLAIVIVVVTAVSPLASASERGNAVGKCVSLAKSYGYRDGQCAHGFIEACLTNSQKKLESAYRTDKMLGMHTGTHCPNMPTDYKAAFDKIF